MRAILTLAAVAVLASAGGATAGSNREPIPEATAAGKPISCIPLRSIRSSKVRSDKVIDFEMAGGKVYRNELPYSCGSLGFEERFSYKTSLNQLCSTDIITVLQSPGLSPGPSCGLGKFQPVTLARR